MFDGSFVTRRAAELKYSSDSGAEGAHFPLGLYGIISYPGAN